MYAFNQKLEHFDDSSFRELFGRIRVEFLTNKMCFKTFGFSTFYTTIPHSKLKYRLKE
jgi:hypothetical protein